MCHCRGSPLCGCVVCEGQVVGATTLTLLDRRGIAVDAAAEGTETAVGEVDQKRYGSSDTANGPLVLALHTHLDWMACWSDQSEGSQATALLLDARRLDGDGNRA